MVILIIKIAISGLKIDGAVYICKWTTTRHPDATVGSFGDGAPHGLQCECPGVVHKEPARLPTVVPSKGHIQRAMIEQQAAALFVHLRIVIPAGKEWEAVDDRMLDHHRPVLGQSTLQIECVQAMPLVLIPNDDVQKLIAKVDDRRAENSPPRVVSRPHVDIATAIPRRAEKLCPDQRVALGCGLLI